MNNTVKRITILTGLAVALLTVDQYALAATPVATPAVDIAQGPLFNGLGNVKPNLLMSLSVEFPTMGAAYRAKTYDKTADYIGYFDHTKCYVYNKDAANVDNNFFKVADTANSTDHSCTGQFSGNFMNWATMSAADTLRYAMTGGHRIVDTSESTVLQRAMLPEADMNGYTANFYARNNNFPRLVVGVGKTSTLTSPVLIAAPVAPSSVTPYTESKIYVISCKDRVLFGTDKTGTNLSSCDSPEATDADLNTNMYITGTTPATFDGMYVRVSVCDATEGPIRTDLCTKYPSGNYKPVGQIQLNADKMRFATTGYLIDNAINGNRYGGVLRAPMKYVGKERYDTNYSLVDNELKEWDSDTGVLCDDPDGAGCGGAGTATPEGNSGVINYINKFGKTGQYKAYDPLGELYYEGIRYFQGKQPSNWGTYGATFGATAAMKDGFPAVQNWVDPVTASCQKNYIINIADHNTQYDRELPGNSANNGSGATDHARAADGALDAGLWTNKIGTFEGRTNLAGTNQGNGAFFIAGLAYYANTQDLRPDATKPAKPKTQVRTFSIDVNEAGGESDPKRRQLYYMGKYGGFVDKNGDGNPFVTTDTAGATVTDGSEWLDPATGYPYGYFLASSPKIMIDGIRNIFTTIGSISGTISGVTLTSTKISTDSAFVYQPGFDSSKWSGNLLKLKLQLVDDVVTIQDAEFPTWDAGLILTGTAATTTPVAAAVPASPAPSARNIYTSKVVDGSLTTVPFSWLSGGLTDAQKALLDNSPVTSVADGLGESRVNYLRGNRTDEIGQANGVFRQRDRVLGDIINSNPTYVAAPASNIQGDDYSTFYEAKKGRTKAVYVGANDGMLHAFNAADGEELFAYVPNAVMPGLNKLTDQNYVHQPYVDGQLTVGEAKVDGSWRTILASGMGGGAQGAFVLDVTNPADFAGGTGAIWEFTDQDDPDMGNLTSPPQIAKFNMGVDATTKAIIYKYFVVIPSGLNNYKDDGYSNFGTTDQAVGALFLLSLDKKPADAWNEGTNYFKLKTAVVPDKQNGLSSPALVLGNDGAVRYAYAGDLQGNMWRFDFTMGAPANKTLGTPLFTAKDSDGAFQPITGQPRVITAPGGGYVVLFGTGKYVEDADAAPGNFKTQSFYGVFDDTSGDVSKYTYSDLTARTLTKDTAVASDAMKIAGENFTYGAPKGQGWYFDFLNSATTGERSVTDPLLAYGRLFFNSLITGSDPCATGGGRTYGLNALTGLPLNADGVSTSGAITGQSSTVGMLSSPILFETGSNVGEKEWERDSIGKRAVKKKFSVFNFGTGGKDGTAAPAANGTGTFQPPAGRMSWREILNWQELHNEAKK